MSMRVRCGAVLVVFSLAMSAQADEATEKWLKFFEGDWTRQSKVWTGDDGLKEEKVSWTGRLTAGGKALVATTSNSSGETMTAFCGVAPSGSGYFEFGVTSQGVSFTIHCEDANGDTLVCKTQGKLPNGASGKGTMTMSRTSDDSYTTEWKLNLDNGTEVKGIEKNQRKRKEGRG